MKVIAALASRQKAFTADKAFYLNVIPNLIWNSPRMLLLFQKLLQALQASKILNPVQDDFIISSNIAKAKRVLRLTQAFL